MLRPESFRRPGSSAATAAAAGRRFCVLAGLLLLVPGCATVSDGNAGRVQQHAASRLKRESMLQSAWRGRTYRSLLDAFGPPRMVMAVHAYFPRRTDVVVYEPSDTVSGCIDAFTIVTERPEDETLVVDYFCR